MSGVLVKRIREKFFLGFFILVLLNLVFFFRLGLFGFFFLKLKSFYLYV